MRRRVIFFVVTVVIAVLIVMLISSALRTKQATIEALRNDHTDIVVAASWLPLGATLDKTNTRLATWPRESLPPKPFSSQDEVVGRVIRQSVLQNQPIVPDLLVDSGKIGGALPLVIPPGMRAMSIPVTPVSDMAGMILPHSRVDVLVTTSAGVTSSNIERTAIVLQNIEVVAVQTALETASNEPQPAEVVTLLVSPAEAEQLGAAIRLGTLQLAMRNYADQKEVFTAGVYAGQLLGPPPAPLVVQQAPPAVAPRPVRRQSSRVIEVFRDGKERQTVSFSNDRPRGNQSSGSGLESELELPDAASAPNHETDASQ